jgi:hypothetical protein
MNAVPCMDATPPDEEVCLAAQQARARTILFGAMALMIGLPVLLFVIFHT